MKQQISAEELKEIVQEKSEEMISKLFEELHQITGISAGDISPDQSEQLNEITTSIVTSLTSFATEKLLRNQRDDQ